MSSIITWIILEFRFCWSLEGGVEGFAPAARGSNWPGGGGNGLCGGGPGGVELGEPSDTRRCGRGGLEGGPGSGGASSLRLLRRSPAIFLEVLENKVAITKWAHTLHLWRKFVNFRGFCWQFVEQTCLLNYVEQKIIQTVCLWKLSQCDIWNPCQGGIHQSSC